MAHRTSRPAIRALGAPLLAPAFLGLDPAVAQQAGSFAERLSKNRCESVVGDGRLVGPGDSETERLIFGYDFLVLIPETVSPTPIE